MASILALRDELEAILCAIAPDVHVNEQSAERLPNIVSITLPGIDADDMVEQLALQGICVSTGSALLPVRMHRRTS